MKPQIVSESWEGRHNLLGRAKEIEAEGLYKDRSTICLVPTRGMIHAKVVQNWWGMMSPMNQKFLRMFMIGMEVGEAYTQAIDNIIAHPELSQWKYILTVEEDNMIPPDGLLKLYNAMDEGFDIVGGLYWTKGEGGQPMCYGDPKVFPKNFIPQIPKQDCVTECNGLGMGFTLFKLDIFKDSRLRKPFFKTIQDYTPGVGASAFTQDLWFFNDVCKYGYKIGCDSRVKVGHFDACTDIIW